MGRYFEHKISLNGKSYLIIIRFAHAKSVARKGHSSPGNLPHGKHAAKNVGVSIVRAGRELELDDAWTIKERTERWWGVEIEFPPELDELFGVTNNKQSANNFTELAHIDFDELLSGGKSITALKEEWDEDGDPRGPLLEIAQTIDVRIKALRLALKLQRSGTKKKSRYVAPEAEDIATDKTKDRQSEGHRGESDIDESLPDEEREKAISDTLEADGVADASELAHYTITGGRKYVFATADLETSAFFSVKLRGGVIIITLNVNHPAYEKLVHILESEEEIELNGLSAEERLQISLEGLKLLLSAWARYEDEQPDGVLRQRVQDSRADWGRIARQFLETD